MSLSKFVCGSLALALVSLADVSAVRAAVPGWDQTDLAYGNAFDVSEYVDASDFVLTNGMLVTGATIWLADGVTGDNGALDSFSGVLSWAIYESTAGKPSALVAAGKAGNLQLVDTGHQATYGDFDVMQVSFELTRQVRLSSGTFFLAIHENGWQSDNDGTPVRWLAASSLSGEPHQVSSNLAPPSGWFSPGEPSDAAFALYGSLAAWAQDTLPTNAYNITDFIAAADFFFEETTVASTFDVWLVDGVTSDNGVLESFNGTLSWGIYHDVAGKPADLIWSGTDLSPDLADTGSQGTGTLGDLVRARIDLGGRRTFDALHYWIALREGAWGAASDGTAIYWAKADNDVGFSTVQDTPPASPTTWPFVANADTAFALYENQLFASGFEAGGTCAWTNGASIDCP